MKIWLLILLALTACAPEVQKSPPISEFSGGISKNTFYAADGVFLPLRSWVPATKPKAVILALHGFNDYSNAFFTTGEYFKTHGIAFYAYDQRGFGMTAQTGIWAGEQNLVSDVKQCLKQLAVTHPRTPIYLMGESMGGAVATLALTQEDAPKVKGLIMVAPALWGREQMGSLYSVTLWAMVNTMPWAEFTGADLKILASNNIPMLRRLGRDPLVIKRSRVDAIHGLVDLMDHAYINLPQLKTPTLLLYGAQDQVIRPKFTEAALARFSQPIDVAHYPLGYHMLLRDLQGEVVMEDILSWINKPKRPLPSGAGTKHLPENQP